MIIQEMNSQSGQGCNITQLKIYVIQNTFVFPTRFWEIKPWLKSFLKRMDKEKGVVISIQCP